jgi:hypothetical protein
MRIAVRFHEAISSRFRSGYERHDDERTYGDHCEASEPALPIRRQAHTAPAGKSKTAIA